MENPYKYDLPTPKLILGVLIGHIRIYPISVDLLTNVINIRITLHTVSSEETPSFDKTIALPAAGLVTYDKPAILQALKNALTLV